MVRCFIGVMLPPNLRGRAVKIQRKFSALPMRCKLVEPQNLHITLAFLGEVDEGKVKLFSKELDEICKSHTKFKVNIAELKIIPSESYIRVLALDVHPKEVLESIATAIQKKMGGKSAPPHLTLARVKKIDDREKVLEGLHALPANLGSFTINSIQLVQSRLLPTGPVYHVLHESSLG